MNLSRMRWLTLVWAAALSFSVAGADAPTGGGKLVATYLELKGHGLAVVLQTPNGKTYLIDSGNYEKSKGEVDAGRDTVAPFLKTHGINEIDGIAISHSHADHYGGAPWLIANYKVKEFIDNGYDGWGQTDAYRKIRKDVVERGGKHTVAHAGTKLDWDKDLQVDVLSPPKEFLLQDADKTKVTEHAVLNNNSLTLRVQYGKTVFIFPGDAYGSENNYMVKNTRPEWLKTTVLCAPHHGFNSTPGYAAILKPEIVIASCIKLYEKSPIPSPADHARLIYSTVGSKIYTSPWHGTIQVTSDGKECTVKTDRDEVPPIKEK